MRRPNLITPVVAVVCTWVAGTDGIAGEPVGQCCFFAPEGVACVDGVTEDECRATHSPPVRFLEGFGCEEGCCDCLQASDCFGSNACTFTVCAELCLCILTPNFDDTTECCDPISGAIELLDDESVCTLPGSCDPATGAVTRPAAPSGITCDDGDPCTTDDRCDGAGGCVGTSTLGQSCATNAACGPGTCIGGVCVCPALAACCLQSNACEILGRAECRSRGGKNVAECRGDLNSDRIDDACEGFPIPATSTWGLVIMTALLLIGARIYFGVRRADRSNVSLARSRRGST